VLLKCLPTARRITAVLKEHLYNMSKREVSQDVGNIVLFEHVNLEITDLTRAIIFYVEAVGLTRDPFKATGPLVTWINLGYQQFHLLTREGKEKGEVILGHIGIIVPSIDHVLRSLKNADVKYKGYHDYKSNYHVVETVTSVPSPFLHDVSRYINITCPWGNTFRVYENNEKINYKGGLGLLYVEQLCKRGTAAKIGAFYHKYLGSPPTVVETTEDGVDFVSVVVGPKQVLIYKETDQPIEYSTYHFCIYIADFSGSYKKVAKDNLLYTKHKFDDKCDTLEQALQNSQFRINTIVDPDNVSDVVFAVEHEVRSLVHPAYLRPLVNKTGNVGIFCNQ